MYANKSCRINSIAARDPKYWNLLPASIDPEGGFEVKSRASSFYTIIVHQHAKANITVQIGSRDTMQGLF